MKEVRIEVTKLNNCPLYSFFMKDERTEKDEYEYLGCIGNSIYSEYEEWEGFESLVRFLLERLSHTQIELPCSNMSYFVHTTFDSWEDEWDRYCIDIDKHSFGYGHIIEVKTGDIDYWKNATLEDFTKELGIILGLKFEVVR